MRKAPESRNRHQGALIFIFVMASSGVVKVILSFYRDDEGSAFERHRDRVPFDIEKHNSMEIACKHLIEFMRIKQQAEKFGLGSSDLKLTDLKVTKKVILLARHARPGPEEQCVHLSVWIYEVGIIL